MSNQIIIENIIILINRKKIKHLYLRVKRVDMQVYLSAPLGMKQELINDFLMSKIDWIKKQQLRFAKSNVAPENKHTSKKQLYYVGGMGYELRIIAHQALKPKILLTDDMYMDLYMSPDTNPDLHQSIIHNWYRIELAKTILPLIDKWQTRTGLVANEYRIKQMKTKWGTCNIAAKRIWLNLELAKKPLDCLEFVIVHELVHLLERGHNARFYGFMDAFMPEWKKYKAQLDGLVCLV